MDVEPLAIGSAMNVHSHVTRHPLEVVLSPVILITARRHCGRATGSSPTGLQSPAYKDWLDFTVYDSPKPVGRIYEDRGAEALEDLRWF